MKSFRFILRVLTCTVGFVSVSTAQARSAPVDTDALCGFTADQVAATGDEVPYKFVYRRILFQAAGVELGRDDPLTIASKMRAWWSDNQKLLYCNELNSSVRRVHILRLAVDRNSNEFLNDVVRRWKVDLNFIDPGSKDTVLDFVDREISKAQGTPRVEALRRYSALLANAGAKRASEIE